ncbi:MAG: gamma-glutamyltranspeptidase / glutathione hydrolase [Acidobacteriota bacterium]|nr:gamma-glutamyltranspeptidase / glutathione hydrolase [Acidobacteriota bacterium]
MDKLWISILLLLGFTFSLFAADRITGKMFATRSEVIGTHGMVAASQPLAVQVGIDILKKGGSAVDAAIAVNAALGLMEPTSCGIGGDLFAIVWDNKTQKLYGLNASGTAPLALNLEYFKKQGLKQIPYHGPLPWTVPGCVDGWFELHKKFGKLDMKTVLQPAADYAENGFPLSELIAHYWQRSVMLFKEYENFQKLYAPGGKLLQKGDIFKNPELAKTLRLIAAKGRDAFYKGEIARAMVAYSQKVGGFFQMKDFEDFHAEWVEPLGVNYKGYDVWELPPNGQGIAVLQMLNMLRAFDLKAMGHNSAEYLHTLVEIKKIVYEDRARFYADPRFVKVSIKRLLSVEYAGERLKYFNPARANRNIPAGDGILEKGDTIYLTVVDKDFNAVSLIQSNYSGFGSGMVPDGLGFCFQDRGQLFSLEEGHPNVIEPGKRPFHTIIPAMVTKNGKPVFTYGVMGGDMQPQGHVQVLLNIVEFGMNIQEAGDAARFYHTGSSEPDYGTMTDGGELHLESGVVPEVVRTLMGKGHKIVGERGGFGGYQGIWIDNERGVLIGASESRKDGCAIGY